MTRKFSRRGSHDQIPEKANRVLNIILIFLVLIAVRVWHLSVVQYDMRLEASRKPQQKVVVEPARRGTIRDRFNTPLAINKLQYNASVIYSQVAQIPRVKWEIQEGKKVKIMARREHVARICSELGRILDLNPDRLEDLIYSKAAFYYHFPFVIKEDISEKQYYQIKMLEASLPGISVQKAAKRHYPNGRLACNILGTMGAITREEYEVFLNQLHQLRSSIERSQAGLDPEFPESIHSIDEAHNRLLELEDLAYSLHDSVGKTGVEKILEKKMRGSRGKRTYLSDAKGDFLKELSDRKAPESGSRVLLTISHELQEFADKLLAENEPIRRARVSAVETSTSRSTQAVKEPWIKGGAIVAMDPNTGEILALSSYPRFDPNDFVSKSASKNGVHEWYETDVAIGQVWDQVRTLKRERFDPLLRTFYDEELILNWNEFIKAILPEKSHIISVLDEVRTLKNGYVLLSAFEQLMALSQSDSAYAVCNFLYRENPHQKRMRAQILETVAENLTLNAPAVEKLKAQLDPIFSKLPNNYDKILLLDLLGLVINREKMTPELIDSVGGFTFLELRQDACAFFQVEQQLYELAKNDFHQNAFKKWREENQKSYLKEMRLLEKQEKKKFNTPYIDLLDQKESELFSNYWQSHRWELFQALLQSNGSFSPELDHLRKLSKRVDSQTLVTYLSTHRPFKEMTKPLFGKYRNLRKCDNIQMQKHLAASFYPKYGYGFCRSHAFGQSIAPGSVFKLITAYAALKQKYNSGGKSGILNLFEMIDDYFPIKGESYIGTTKSGQPIPQNYKGGRIPRSHRAGLGKVDLLKALEVSSNPYFSLLAAEHLNQPQDLADAAKEFGFGEATGIGLGAERKGFVPNDLDINKTGLYTTAIGQHTLLATPLQVAVMLSTIANKGKVLQPLLIHLLASKSGVEVFGPKVKREIDIPEPVFELLVEGMRRVASNIQQTAPYTLREMYKKHPEAISTLVDLKGDFVAKSSTAEVVETIDMDIVQGTNRYNHLWFGSIIFEPVQEAGRESVRLQERYRKPELVVVVYLRYGSWGKDGAPLAAQIASKWREIKNR